MFEFKFTYLIIWQYICFPHVLEQLQSLREYSHLVPVGAQVSWQEDIPQGADVGEKCLGPERVILMGPL